MAWETLGLLALLLIVGSVAFGLLRGASTDDFVYPWQRGLLYVDGKFERVLEPGRYRAFDPAKRRKVELVQVVGLFHRAQHDVVSADRLVYRLTASVEYEVSNPRLWHETNGRQTLANAVERAVAEVAAARSLEEVLGGREPMNAALAERLDGAAAGAAVVAAGIVAVTLPPEIRRAYAETERARHEGAAALERARGEQASLRSLANAARMLKDNPELLNLRLLQSVGANGKGASIVLGEGALLPGRSR